MTNGQRVPEDLHLAKSNYLIDRAFKMARAKRAPYSLKSDEYQLLTSAFVGTPELGTRAMEDQAASLRRLTPAAQVGRSFAFWECPAAVSPPWSAKWQPA